MFQEEKMSTKKDVKKDKINKDLKAQELNLDDLENVSGGAGLRKAPKTKTVDISDDTKSKI